MSEGLCVPGSEVPSKTWSYGVVLVLLVVVVVLLLLAEEVIPRVGEKCPIVYLTVSGPGFLLSR